MTGKIAHIDVVKNTIEIKSPEVFGDNYCEELCESDRKLVKTYFQRKEKVNDYVSFINFRVEGKDNIIQLQGQKNKHLAVN
jgi:hypothetical protein